MLLWPSGSTRRFPPASRAPRSAHLLKVPLYPYQREGALFAARAGRSLIADDMGLGKTIQAIAACEILAQTAGIERVLIVCPTSLKYQWKQEIEKFCARPALVVEGSLARRAELYAAESFYKITNYEVMHRDLDAIRRWGPEVDHSRRGPADQELEDPPGPDRQDGSIPSTPSS